MSSSSLPNYLRSHRKRLALSQPEVAFLLGLRGESKGAKVCRDERFVRKPNLDAALAYEAIYGCPVRELFAGLYHQIEREVAGRAKVLTFRKEAKQDKQASCKRQLLLNLAARQSKRVANPPQS